MALAALTRDRVLHYLPRQVKFYFLSFHAIDIKRFFQRNKLLYLGMSTDVIEPVRT